MSGAFIVIEGIEGAGKSTLIEDLKKSLKPALEKFSLAKLYNNILFTKEPGGTAFGQRIRDILLHQQDLKLSSLTETLLFFADRHEHLSQIVLPALKENNLIISDRFTYSTIAYQGYGRGIPLDELEQLNSLITKSFRPHLVILLDMDPAVGLRRLEARYKSIAGAGFDNIEKEGIAFHTKIREGFLAQAKQHNDIFEIIDAGRSPAETLRDVLDVICKFVGN